MTTTTTTRDSGIALRCSFQDEDNGNMRCAWVASAGNVDEMRGEYSRHWASVHADPPPGRRIREEVKVAKASGRWMDDLLEEIHAEGLEPVTEASAEDGERVELIPVERIDQSPFQTRDVPDDSVGDLAESIRHNGQVVPATARRHPGNPQRYQLAYGHRRLAALKTLAAGDPGRFGVMRVVVQELDDGAMIRAVAGENTGRRDLTQLETARAIRKLLEESAGALAKKDVAEAFGIAPSTLSNMLRILESFDETQLKYVEAGKVQWSAMRPLLGFVGEDGHRHDGLINQVLLNLTRTNRGAGEKEAASTARATAIYMGGFKPLDQKARSGSGYLYSAEISVEEYSAVAAGKIHKLGEQGTWGCDGKAFEKLQAAARRSDDAVPTEDLEELRAKVTRLVEESGSSAETFVIPELIPDSYGNDVMLPVDLRREIEHSRVWGSAMRWQTEDGRVVVAVEPVQDRMVDGGDECRSCTHGRSLGINRDGDFRTLCSDNDCLIKKLAGYRAQKAEEARAAEKIQAVTVERAKASVLGKEGGRRKALDAVLVVATSFALQDDYQGEQQKYFEKTYGLKVGKSDEIDVERLVKGVGLLKDQAAAELAVDILTWWSEGWYMDAEHLTVPEILRRVTGCSIPELSGGK